MRTETIIKTIYTFEELSEQGKERAIERYWDINVGHEWWENTYEDAANIGLKITSFDLDRYRHATGEFILSASEVAANIIRDHGEICETYKTAQGFLTSWEPVFADYLDEESDNFESWESEQSLQELEDEFLKALLEDYSIILQNEYDYLTSEEAIAETLISNEYEFTENGEIY